MDDGVMRGAGSRVLYTGKGEDLIDTLMELLQEQYVQTKCPPALKEFTAELDRVQPQAVVICLDSDESNASLQVFRVLEKEAKYAQTAVVVICEEEANCNLFAQVVPVKRLTLLPHPTDVMEIMERIEDAVAPVISFGAPHAEEEASAAKDEKGAPAAAASSAASAAPAAPMAEYKPTILVVDDDVLMLNTIKSFLQDFYDVSVVPSGKLALKFLAKKRADLVLLDYMMPEMDGPAVFQSIREDSPHPEVPVLFLTGVAEKDLVMRGLSHLPDGYLLKPVDRDTLLERVMEILMLL